MEALQAVWNALLVIRGGMPIALGLSSLMNEEEWMRTLALPKFAHWRGPDEEPTELLKVYVEAKGVESHRIFAGRFTPHRVPSVRGAFGSYQPDCVVSAQR